MGQQSSFCFKNAHTFKALFLDSISKEEVRFHAGTVRSWLWVCKNIRQMEEQNYLLLDRVNFRNWQKKVELWYSMAKKGSNCTVVFYLMLAQQQSSP